MATPAKRPTREVKVEDLDEHGGQVIVDPQGNFATVRRVHRINGEKCRITTDMGGHIALLDELVRVLG